MKNLLKLILLVHIILLSAFSCKKEEMPQSESNSSLCNSGKKIVKEVTDSFGQIWFNQPLQEYAVYVGINGSYDSQIIGVPCNIQEEFKKEGLKVKFSGRYKEFDKQPTQILPGQKYYYLEISKIQLK